MLSSQGDNFALEGRTALVTGGSRGIGRAIARALADHRAHVLIHCHREKETADRIAQVIKESGGSAAVLQGDLTQSDAGRDLARSALRSGPIDILVLNAAIQERRELAQVDRELFQRHVDANFWSSIQLLQELLPPMAERGWGRILGIGSVQQLRPNPNLLVYAGLKSALSTILISLAKAYAQRGVTLNTLAPGLIDTDRTNDLKEKPELYRSILDRIPIGRAGTAEDCAGAALLLCSDAGRYITGVDLLVDGGMHLP